MTSTAQRHRVLRGLLTVLGALFVATLFNSPATASDNERGQFIFGPDLWSLDYQIVNELAIREPSMCAGRAWAKIRWNRNQGWVKIRARFKGLPYQPSFRYDDFNGNPGHKLNPMPDQVVNGTWQIWLIGRWATITGRLYWDANTGELLGSNFDLGEEQPAGTIASDPVPFFHLVCTDMFESDPQALKADVEFTFDYHQILDSRGRGGTVSTIAPKNLFDPDNTLDLYTVVGGLPPEMAMNWDDVLRDVRSGAGTVALYTTLEPPNKDAWPYLRSRDNSMIGWAALLDPRFIVPLEPPAGFEACGTYQLDNYFGFIPPPTEE